MIEHVHPSDLAAWLDKMKTFGQPVVIDVREPHELQTASIKAQDFELVTIPMGDIPSRLSELDSTRPIACLCHHGARSQRVAEYLAGQGFGHVANITGGINAWSMQIDPTVPRY
jgi:rhodanese-related sulfurtransferase